MSNLRQLAIDEMRKAEAMHEANQRLAASFEANPLRVSDLWNGRADIAADEHLFFVEVDSPAAVSVTPNPPGSTPA